MHRLNSIELVDRETPPVSEDTSDFLLTGEPTDKPTHPLIANESNETNEESKSVLPVSTKEHVVRKYKVVRSLLLF